MPGEGENPRRTATMRDVARKAGVGLAPSHGSSTASRVWLPSWSGVSPRPPRPSATATTSPPAACAGPIAVRPPSRWSWRTSRTRSPQCCTAPSRTPRARAEILVLAGSSDEHPDRERELIDAFTLRRVDGLIVLPTGSTDDQLAAVRRARHPGRVRRPARGDRPRRHGHRRQPGRHLGRRTPPPGPRAPQDRLPRRPELHLDRAAAVRGLRRGAGGGGEWSRSGSSIATCTAPTRRGR